MKLGKPYLYPIFSLLLTACGSSSVDVADPDDEGTVGLEIEIDATAGGLGAAQNDPLNKFTYINLDSGEVVALTDEEAASSTDWHVGFKRAVVIFNSGVSGAGNVLSAWMTTPDGFYNGDGEEVADFFFATTRNSDVVIDAFNDVDLATMATADFQPDQNMPNIPATGSGNSWWLDTGTATANTDNWWVIRSGYGDSYIVMRPTIMDAAQHTVSFEYYLQNSASTTFNKSQLLTVTFDLADAEDDDICFDFDAPLQLACDDGYEWDLMLQVNADASSWNIWTNGAVYGNQYAAGASFGPLDNADIDSVGNDEDENDESTDIPDFLYLTDRQGNILDQVSWYAYNLTGNHELWPNFRVYAVNTGTHYFKFQILSYYDLAGTSAVYQLRYLQLD